MKVFLLDLNAMYFFTQVVEHKGLPLPAQRWASRPLA